MTRAFFLAWPEHPKFAEITVSSLWSIFFAYGKKGRFPNPGPNMDNFSFFAIPEMFVI
jgi:hypothetical protein